MLPRGIRQQDHATHETLELAERESPFDWALGSHSPGGDRVSHCRALGADARSLLGGNRDSGCDAIHSRRYADALRRAHRCHRRWRVSRSTRVKLLRSESCRLHAGDLFHRPTFVWLSAGEDRLSICQCHPDDHCLIPRTNPAWIVALHRFIEVSVGIIVALLVVAIWPEQSPIAAKNADQ